MKKKQDSGFLYYRDKEDCSHSFNWSAYIQLGLTAEMDLFFKPADSPSFPLFRALARPAAFFAMLRAAAKFRPQKMDFSFDGEGPKPLSFTHLLIVNKSIFPDAQAFYSPAQPQDGYLYAYLWLSDSAFERVRISRHISRKNFSEISPARSFKIKRIGLQSERKFKTECDGRIFSTKQLTISLPDTSLAPTGKKTESIPAKKVDSGSSPNFSANHITRIKS